MGDPHQPRAALARRWRSCEPDGVSRALFGFWVSPLGVAAFAILVSLYGCKATGPAPDQAAAKVNGKNQVRSGEAQPGSLVAARYRFRVAVYHAHAPTPEVRAIIERLARDRFALVADDAAAERASGATLVVSSPTLAEFDLPDAESLHYFARGLSAQDEQALLASQAVTALSFRGPGDQASVQYRAALQLVGALVRESGGYPWDDEARLVYTPASFRTLLDDWQGNEPLLSDHVALHAYRNGELIRIVSLGMVKFGLPDLAVNQVGSAASGPMGSLANLVCQTMFEQGKLGSGGKLVASIDALKHDAYKAELMQQLDDNAQRRVELRLAVAFPERGDADNRLLEVAFPGNAKALQEQQAAAILQLFGGHDSMVMVKHDQALLAASTRARQKALLIGKRYSKGPPFGEQLTVKAPFSTSDGGTEWMWVEVVRWNGDDIDGILKNDPFDVPSLKLGARVEVRASKIFDYILVKEDGSQEGNETGAILEAHEKSGAEVRKK
jgi:uncharacterized protein YegJ (DUF2314 family)